MDAVVLENGQITIPKELREKLGIQAGTLLELTSSGGKLILEKKPPADPFSKWCGRGKLPSGFNSVDEYLTWIRNGGDSSR